MEKGTTRMNRTAESHRIPKKYVCVGCGKAVLQRNNQMPAAWVAMGEGFFCYDCKGRA